MRHIFTKFTYVATIVSALVLGACSSTNKREAASLVSIDEQKITVESVWSTSVGKSETFVMRPVVAGDYI